MRDEIEGMDKRDREREEVHFYVDFLIHKIRSLSSNNRVIDYPEKNPQR